MKRRRNWKPLHRNPEREADQGRMQLVAQKMTLQRNQRGLRVPPKVAENGKRKNNQEGNQKKKKKKTEDEPSPIGTKNQELADESDEELSKDKDNDSDSEMNDRTEKENEPELELDEEDY